MKRIFILLPLIFVILFACGEENEILEPVLSTDKIDFPKKQLEDGRVLVIYRNYEELSVSMSLMMLSNTIIPNSNNEDFCDGVTNLRNGKGTEGWTTINYNYSMKPESQIENQNDHPNLVSYNLPVGTYLVMLMDPVTCSKENYAVFDVKRNKYVEGLMKE